MNLISGSFTHLLEGVSREPIKITGVKTTRLTYQPLDGSYIHECGPVVLTKYDVAVVEVFTDQGIVGIGPGAVNGPDHYDHLIGRNPFDVELLGLPAGLDVACWDIIGKAKGKPVYQLLATDHEPNPRVHVYASGGVLWTYYDKGDGQPYGVEALIKEALRYKAMGFDTFKWRPGTDWEEAGINPTKLGEICRKLREAVGPDFNLGLEKKGYDSWTFEECMKIAPIINDLSFLFFEQPMGDEGPAQFEDYLRIKEQMPKVMLWGGERFRSLAQARPWLEQRIYDAVQSDAYIIGLTENWHLARVAAFYGVKLVPHNWSSSLGTMANVHLVAGVPNGHLCEFFLYPNPFREKLFKEPYRPVNGYITLSNKPGFGMELAEDLEKQFPYIPGPNTVANPRFPHAWPRALAREEMVRRRYGG
ncbi:MAG: mandelate racemase/muconate lactonizing enzyme family protein [Caldilineaceae bacterium]